MAKLFENHPHFAIFPGDSIEIMESLPIPDRMPFDEAAKLFDREAPAANRVA